MAKISVGLRDVSQGKPESRLRILAPLHYLAIKHEEKYLYDFAYPVALTFAVWLVYLVLDPKPPIFGPDGILKFTDDLLMMAVPFMIGSLAAVAMGAPGPYLDKRPAGAQLHFRGQTLTMRQFVCYLLGYLSFLGLILLGLAVVAELMRPDVLRWIGEDQGRVTFVRDAGALVLFFVFSCLTITTFWSLYFLTEIVNRPSGS